MDCQLDAGHNVLKQGWVDRWWREGQVVYTEDYRKIAIQVPIVPLLVVAASESTKDLFSCEATLKTAMSVCMYV